MKLDKYPLIIGKGDLPEIPVLNSIWKNTGLKICCDGAFDSLQARGKQPDIVIGDLDSIQNSNLVKQLNIKLIQMDEQDTTDSEKACNYCLSQGYKTAVALGMLGRRMDHTLYNLLLTGKMYQRGLKLVLLNDKETIFVAEGVLELHKPRGTRISFVPLFGRVGPINSTGLRFPLAGRELSPKGFCAISNEIREDSTIIEIENGMLLVLLEGQSDWS